MRSRRQSYFQCLNAEVPVVAVSLASNVLAGPAAILQRVTDNVTVAVSEAKLHLAGAVALFYSL